MFVPFGSAYTSLTYTPYTDMNVHLHPPPFTLSLSSASTCSDFACWCLSSVTLSAHTRLREEEALIEFHGRRCDENWLATEREKERGREEDGGVVVMMMGSGTFFFFHSHTKVTDGNNVTPLPQTTAVWLLWAVINWRFLWRWVLEVRRVPTYSHAHIHQGGGDALCCFRSALHRSVATAEQQWVKPWWWFLYFHSFDFECHVNYSPLVLETKIWICFKRELNLGSAAAQRGEDTFSETVVCFN